MQQVQIVDLVAALKLRNSMSATRTNFIYIYYEATLQFSVSVFRQYDSVDIELSS